MEVKDMRMTKVKSEEEAESQEKSEKKAHQKMLNWWRKT